MRSGWGGEMGLSGSSGEDIVRSGGMRMDRARELQALLAGLQACLVQADALRIELVAIFLSQAIDRMKLELKLNCEDANGPD